MAAIKKPKKNQQQTNLEFAQKNKTVRKLHMIQTCLKTYLFCVCFVANVEKQTTAQCDLVHYRYYYYYYY